ncbi:MAG: hypothetical protein F4Y37_10065 [Caldilineaceae bacterium SB0664_bin_22]|nr:hypothetical protein [Caldilineaceae bacterium SB0664_bin_22]
MAQRTPTKRKSAASPWQALLASLYSPRLAGTVLVMVAVLTQLSFMSLTRGRLTDMWIGSLQSLVGVAAWGLPAVIGFLGFWIIVRAMEYQPMPPWHKPAGVVLLYLCLVVGLTLMPDQLVGDLAQALSPSLPSAGGWIGYRSGTHLEEALGLAGAWTVLVGLVLAGGWMLVPEWLERQWWRAVSRTRAWWEQLGRVDRREREHAPWPETRLYRVWQRVSRHRIDLGPLRRVYGRVWFAYVHWLERMRTPRTAPLEHGSPTVETVAVPARPPAVREGAAMPSAERSGLPEGGVEQAWSLPDINQLLYSRERIEEDDDRVRKMGTLIQDTLELFGVPASFEGAYTGSAVTQYLIKPGFIERSDTRGYVRRTKVKVSKITSLRDDLALAAAAASVRIEAPIPGTSYVGIEIPNAVINSVNLRDLVVSDAFLSMNASLPLALGEDVKGQPIVADLARMPHLLIAGATGTGKSVCINAIITTLLLSHTPETLRFLMVDPKMVELSAYNRIPHMLKPVVTDVEQAEAVLEWCVAEMTARYQLLNVERVRDIHRYNQRRIEEGEPPMPFIVAIIDEMADLMMSAPQQVEQAVCRLAQMARAVGIHLIIATQRPSVDVITGLIKANFPARIAFAVSSQIDSRVIIDEAGAERLLGNGDMLFVAPDAQRVGRVQGTWVSDPEIAGVIDHWEAEANLWEPGAFPATSGTESGWTVENHEELVSTPVDLSPLDRAPLPPAGKPEPEPDPGQEIGPQRRPGREPESAAVERLRQIVSTGQDSPGHGATGQAAAAKSSGPGLSEDASGMKGGASGKVGSDRPNRESSPGETVPQEPPARRSESVPSTVSSRQGSDRAGEQSDVGATDSDRDEPDSAPVPPAPESKEGLYLRALDEAKGLKVLSANVLQRRLQLGRNGVFEILQRMLDEGAIDEDDLDSRTFVELVRRQA